MKGTQMVTVAMFDHKSEPTFSQLAMRPEKCKAYVQFLQKSQEPLDIN